MKTATNLRPIIGPLYADDLQLDSKLPLIKKTSISNP